MAPTPPLPVAPDAGAGCCAALGALAWATAPVWEQCRAPDPAVAACGQEVLRHLLAALERQLDHLHHLAADAGAGAGARATGGGPP
jgi:hypothetical protein